MIVGEAPGEDEDRVGKPFVGAAGKLLTKMLGAINLDREKDVFITNILKCRPPGNRNPNTEEALACAPILSRQIDIISPKLLLVMGRVAARELLGQTESIAKLRGKKLDYRGIPVVISYHPAALLRNASFKRPAWDDLRRLQALLKEL
jgi:DNA polymerase